MNASENRFTRTRLLLLALVLAPSSLFSQAITANVVGSVTDPSGAAVPHAAVVIRNQQTNQARAVTTDELGKYEYPFLPVGVYTLTVDARGFQRAEVAAFSLSVDQVARVDVKLSVGQSSETVQVVADRHPDANRKRDRGNRDRQPEGGGAAVERPVVRATGAAHARSQSRHARQHHRAASARRGGTGGRHVRQRRPRHAEPILLRRHRSDGPGQLQLQLLALDRRHPRIQGAEQHLLGRSGRVARRAGEPDDQERRQCVPRHALGSSTATTRSPR